MCRTLVLALALAGCSEFDLLSKPDADRAPGPDIVVDPPSLTFGMLSDGEQEVLPFTVRNVGDATLNVTEVALGAGLAFTVLDPAGFDLEPGGEQVVEVAFTPMGADENFGQVLVRSDDADTPEAPVDLLGFGAVPELLITPASYVFGDTFVPCGASTDLRLENVGVEDLVITEVAYTSGGQLSIDDSALRAELPATLAPGETRTVTVTFAASTAGSDTGVYAVTSNDPRGVVEADQNGEGSYAETRTETFTEPGVPPVDVMLLVDQSGSMEGDNFDDVALGIPDFLDELRQVADWQLVLVTAYDGCATGGVIDPSTPNPEGLLVDNAFPGDDHDRTEALLELASVALGRTGPGGCNEGFLRPGSLLHVIALSDEPEQSGQPADFWVADYTTYVVPELLRVSAIIDLSDCGDGGAGYVEAAAATGGATLDICDASWGGGFASIASEVLPGSRSYTLSEEPDPASVTVEVNGTPTTDIAVAGTSVTVNAPPVGEGDVVVVEYGVLAECP